MNTAANVTLIQRPSSAALLQARLKEAEAQIDGGLINAADLVGQTIRTAEEAGIHRAEIQRMLVRLHSAIGFSLKSQWDLQAFHQAARSHLAKLDLQELGWGDTGSPTTALAFEEDTDKIEA